MPLVSVVVPAHNAASHLGDALESLRIQTVTDIEVLVVDDGSTDDTERVARSYAERDARFRVLRCEKGSGRPGCARNIGLRAARGTYVALLDADDVAVATRLELSLRALRLTGASIAFGDFRKFRDGSETDSDDPYLRGRQFVERAAEFLDRVDDTIFRCSDRFAAYLLADIPAINAQTFVALRTAITAAGPFDESLVGGEDLDLFLRLVGQYPAVYVDQVQTLMRLHDASLTATQTDRCMQDAIRVRRAHLARLHASMTVPERRDARRVIAAMLADLGYNRWVRGEGASARAALLDSWHVRRDARVARMYLKAWLPRAPLLQAHRRLTRRFTSVNFS
jgi:glycosyltransferase involved in cell wall biosynthesis